MHDFLSPTIKTFCHHNFIINVNMLAVFIYIILLNSGNFLYLLTKSQKHLLE